MRARALAIVCILAALGAAGCKEGNPDYCDAAVANHFSCAKERADAARHDGPVAEVAHDAQDAGDAADVVDASDGGDAFDGPPPLCKVDTDCPSDGGLLACDTSAGGARCVQCTKAEHCASQTTKKACDTKVHQCVECVGPTGSTDGGADAGTASDAGGASDAGAPAACKFDPSKSACLVAEQICVQCTQNAHCAGETTKKVCDTKAHVCVGCVGTGSECTTDPSHGVCNVATQSCVQCLDSKRDCPSAAPICEANACRACKKDAECAKDYGAEPGLCVNGACAAAGQVIYLQNGSACSPTVRGDGSLASPFCYSSDATAALSAQKPAIIVRGPLAVEPLSISFAGAPATVTGRAGAKFAEVVGAAPLISISGGDVTLRDLTVSGGAGPGVSATGGTLRMTRCQILNNGDAGIATKNAAFDITNTVVAGQMGSAAVSLGTHPGVGPKRFDFNSVVNNVGTGVFCGQAFTLQGLLVNGNGTPFVGMCTTDGTTSTAAPAFDAARPYHLTAASPCRDKGGTTGLPVDDLDGETRPQGGPAGDCGADELPVP